MSSGFPLTRSQILSKQVCRPCSPKIWNAAELYTFIEKAVSAKPEEDLNWEADYEDRAKRALPTTVTPERGHAKKLFAQNRSPPLERLVLARKALIQRTFPGAFPVILRTKNSISDNETFTTTDSTNI